jgi:hypothetical protein
VDDPRLLCGINEYCTDQGTCQQVKLSPLYKAPCPYEGGGMCGAGLFCIEHVCLACEEGAYDSTDGKKCYNGEWTYSRWTTLPNDPSAVFLLVIMIIFFLSLIRPLIFRKGSWRKGYILKWLRKRWVARQVWTFCIGQLRRILRRKFKTPTETELELQTSFTRAQGSTSSDPDYGESDDNEGDDDVVEEDDDSPLSGPGPDEDAEPLSTKGHNQLYRTGSLPDIAQRPQVARPRQYTLPPALQTNTNQGPTTFYTSKKVWEEREKQSLPLPGCFHPLS